jgi:PHD/YefM family antitoxin component YafN of YafNO toxin-antitoxin module
MPKMNYDILTRNGKEQFVVIPLADYKALVESAEDEADHRTIQASKKRNAGKPLVPHEQVLRDFGLTPAKKRRGA